MITTIIYTVIILGIISFICSFIIGAHQRQGINEGFTIDEPETLLSGAEGLIARFSNTWEAGINRASEAETTEISSCIRCARCVSACKPGLEPYLLAALSDKRLWQRAEEHHIMQCTECGACSRICPANRPLLSMIKHGKAKMEKYRTAIYNG